MDVTEAARGRWLHILPLLGIDEKHLKTNTTCPLCPNSDDRASFTDYQGKGTIYCRSCGSHDGFDILQAFHGWSFKQAAAEVARVLNVSEDKPKFMSKPDPARALRHAFNGSKPISEGDPATLYLRRRGLTLAPKTLRHHPGLPVAGTRYGALLGLLRDVHGNPVTFHRTFITPDGKKAPLENPKMLMPGVATVTGAAIRLYKVTDTVGLCEGLETALSCAELFKLPVWSCVSAHGLESVVLPDTIRHVTIFPDHDLNYVGQKAGYSLAARLVSEGRTVTVKLPPIPGNDWLEELNLRQRFKN